MADPEVKIRVRTEESGGSSALGKVRSEISQLAGAIPGVSAAMGALATGAGVIGVAMATAARSIREFAQAEEGIAKLDAALANSGNLTEDNRNKLQALAAQLQATTAVADDQWVEVLTKLVQFGAKPETIGMDIEAVKNLAGVVGDVSTATTLYAKALQGNFEALGRYGIKVKEIGELQAVAAERGAGQLEAKAQSLNGLFSRLSNSTGDFFEALGQGIARTGIVQGVLSSLSDIMGGLAEQFGTAYESLQFYNRETEGTAEAIARYRAEAEQVLALTSKHVQQLQAEGKLLSEKQRLLDQITDKQAAMDLARVDLDVATGRMTEKDAVKARAGIRYRSAREKIERGRATETDQLKLQEDSIVAMEERKAVVDRQLAEERKRLIPEEKMAKIQALVRSAAQSRKDYQVAGTFAGEIESVMTGDPLGSKSAASLAADLAGMQSWEESIMQRTTNQAALRRARVKTLEDMSSQLGGNIADSRASLVERQAFTRGSAIGANMDLATARMEQLASSADGGNQKLDGASRALANALGENAALSRALVVQAEQFKRDIAQIRAQVKDHANR